MIVTLDTLMSDAAQLRKDTRWVNKVLGEMNHNQYHDSVPLDRVNDALRAHGFDELEPMILCGREGTLHQSVGRSRWLSLTWYKMESGRYEVVAYVS
jgi:hypothetical protein